MLRAIRIYTALISQTGTAAPTAKILKNDLTGPIIWARTDVGTYTATLPNTFTTDKTYVNITNNFSDPDTAINVDSIEPNTITIETYLLETTEDGWFNDTPIEIRIYQ